MTSLTADDLPTVFSDLEPIAQKDPPSAVCQIDYPPKFVKAFDYFRGVLQVHEISERALELTALCLQLNPANYTVWHFRRECLFMLNEKPTETTAPEGEVQTDVPSPSRIINDNYEQALVDDLILAAALGGDNPKNYQIWYHRRALLEHILTSQPSDHQLFIKFARRELEYTASVFEADSKNYHSWCYRQWVVKTLSSCVGSDKAGSVWSEEVTYSDHMIRNNDVRNNSAWNQRWFSVHQGQLRTTLSKEVARTEADYAIQEGAHVDPYNECPWRYLIAVLKEQIRALGDDGGAIDGLLQDYFEKTQSVKSVLRDSGRDPENCANLAAASVDILEMKGGKDDLEHAKVLMGYLGDLIDPIRQKYWQFRTKQLEEILAEHT